MDARYKIILYPKKLKDKTHPIYLRVTKDGKRKYFTTELSAISDDWNSDAERFEDEVKYQTENDKLLEVRAKANKIIRNLKDETEENEIDYTLDDFETRYTVKRSSSMALAAFEDHITDLRDKKQYGNATAYERCLDMLQKCDNKFKYKKLQAINYKFVIDFDKWLIRRGNNANTRKYYLKTLRALLNVKKINDKTLEAVYPFTKFKVSKLKNPTDSRALPLVYLNSLKEARYIGAKEDARQLWMFSYYCRGMSFVDMAYLEQSNIEVRDNGEYIKYLRKKTILTNTGEDPYILIIIDDNIRQILEYFRTRPLIGDYLTPIISKDLDGETLYSHYRNRYKKMMLWLSRIKDDLEFEHVKLTYHMARHTSAVVLKRAGKAIGIISKGLGHSDLKTTEIYLDSFQDEIDQLGEAL